MHPNTLVPETWLDLLPVEIAARIPHFLPCFTRLRNDKRNYQSVTTLPDVLSYSQVSPHQAAAVALSTASVFHIYRINELSQSLLLTRLWRAVLPSIREVSLPLNIGVTFSICDILALPSLRKASIPAFPSFLRALVHGASVRDLTLQITNTQVIDGETGLDLLGTLFKKCPITNASISCLSCGGPAFWNHHTCETLNALCRQSSDAVISQSLTSLTLHCESHLLSSITYLPALFPSLDSFALKIGAQNVYMSPGPVFTPSLVNTLKSFKKLSFIDSGIADVYANFLRERLVNITSWMLHNSASLVSLAHCPNLTCLQLLLDENVIHHFPDNIRSLRSLTLEWDGESYTHQQGYFQPDTRQLNAIIRRNTHLSQLRLKKVRVPYAVVESILSRTGPRLEVLELPIFKQKEDVIQRFDNIIRLVRNHAPLVHTLEFDVDSTLRRGKGNSALFRELDPSISDHHPEDDPGDVTNCQRCKLWNMADAAWNLLRARLHPINEEGFIAFKQSVRNSSLWDPS